MTTSYILDDQGFTSRYFGRCVICLDYFEPGELIGSAPRQHWHITPEGKTLRFAHIKCVLTARREALERQALTGGA